jgi:EmrB/QacA subfamily drug resistance transporter
MDRPSIETRGRRRGVLVVVGLGTMLGALAGSSAMLALPRISAHMGLDVGATGWIITSFLIVMTVLLLPAGRVSDMLGHRRMYLSGFVVFGAASILCGLSPSFWFLMGSRLLQAVGAAMVVAPGPALLTTTFPPEERGNALGMLATATYIGLSVGPFVGGWVLAVGGWSWVFFMNAPIALIVLIAGMLFLPKVEGQESERQPFDLPGLVLLALGLPPLLLALSLGSDWGWTSVWVLASAAAGVVTLALFVAMEFHSPHPLISPRLFRSCTFTCASLGAVGIYTSLFLPIFLLPFYLVDALELEPWSAGLVLTAQPVVMALVSTPSGRLSDRIGYRIPTTVGLIVLATGIGLMSRLGPQTHPAWAALYWAITGLGTGLFVSPNSSALMGSAPSGQQGVAGAVLAVARSLGMMFGVALATIVFAEAGGHTGQKWVLADHRAMSIAMYVASGIAVLAAIPSLMQRGDARHGGRG